MAVFALQQQNWAAETDHKARVSKIFITQIFMKRSTNPTVDKSKDVNEVGKLYAEVFSRKFPSE